MDFDRWSQRLRTGLFWVVLLGLVILQSAGLPIPFAGGFHDDGVYLVTAKALAEGRGYSIESLPQPLAQTKYPIVFPAFLAAVWKLNPNFPANLFWLRMVPLTATWLWMGAIWWLTAKELGRPRLAAWLVLLTIASPAVTYLALQPLSEGLFSLLVTLALILLVRLRRSERIESLEVVAAALLISLAYHTRTIGIALFPAGIVVLVRKRRWSCLVVYAAVFLAAAAPWWIWQAIHPIPGDPILDYYTKGNYLSWNPFTGTSTMLPVLPALKNLVWICLAPYFVWQLPPVLFPFALIPLCLPVVLFIGASRWVKSPAEPIGVFLACYVGITLLWTWPPGRFLIPVVPFLALLVRSSAAWGRGFRFALIMEGVAAALVVWGSAVTALNMRASAEMQVLQGPFGRDSASWPDRLQAYHWIKHNTLKGEILAANLDPNLWLYCGRKAVRAFAADPISLFYDPRPNATPLGSSSTLVGRLQHHRVSILIFEDSDLFGETRHYRRAIDELLVSCPGLLRRVFVSASGRVEIYRLSQVQNAAETDAACTCTERNSGLTMTERARSADSLVGETPPSLMND